MKILYKNKLQDYSNVNIQNNDGKISLVSGSKVDFNPKTKYIVPGFIDQHIHGLLGYDTMDNSVVSITTQSEGLLKEGTTSFCPTTMSYDINKINSVLSTINSVKDDVLGAQIIGVHLEGPFISPKKAGAQNKDNILELSVENFNKIQHSELIKIVTYAPELDKNFEFINMLKSKGIVGSVGHSNATCEEVLEAHKKGLSCYTHLHNAMSGYSNREPGVLTAAFTDQNSHKEIIADSIHIDPLTLNATYHIIDSEKLVLITDAMRAKSMPDGIYDLGGLEVYKKGFEARLTSNDSLAGSVLQMNKAVENMYRLTDANLEEIFKMASYNSAQLLNLKSKGYIDEGYDFDITCLDENFNVVEVYIKGEKKYENQNI